MNAVHPERPPCPSRLRFVRLLAGELEPAQAQELQRHVEHCARCSALLAELRNGRDAFSPVLPDLLVQRVRATSKLRRDWARWTTPALAAAGALLAWLLWREPPSVPNADGVRSKGGMQLGFYVLHAGAVRAGTDGERVQPGDQLEFAYSSERDAYLAIVSIDAAGRASAYYARDGRAVKIAAAGHAVLDQSTLLDDTLGPELVYALSCTQPIATEPVLQTLERSPDQPPAVAGCEVTRYALLKVAR
jgi:anti-sigma factor RsiW